MQEYEELKAKVDRLKAFRDTNAEWAKASRTQQGLLLKQINYMIGYMETLEQRLKDFAWEAHLKGKQ